MKVLALLFLVGCASASFYDALDHASDDLLVDFMVGMDKVKTLSSVLGSGYSEEAETIEDDIKTSLGKSLRETLNSLLEKIRNTVDHGKQVGQELVEKAKEIADKLKELGLDAGSKAKDLLERLKEKAKDWLKNLLEKLGLGKRDLSEWISGLLGNFNLKELLQKLKNKIAEHVSLEGIMSYIKNLFGDSMVGSFILSLIKDKGIQAIKDLISRILPSSVGGVDYSIVDMWAQIKEFFSGLGVQIRDHFSKFAEWLRETVRTGFENAKDKAAKLQEIAKQVLEHSKTLTKEAAQEALEFFQPYKEDLGALWDQLKETVTRVIGN